MSTLRVRPSGRPLVGEVTVPGDKSIAHRAVLFGAIAEGTQIVEGLPRGADVRASIRVTGELGAEIEQRGDTVRVTGVGHRFAARGPDTIDCANSGTTLRLLAGILAAGPRAVTLDGDASLRNRPMERVAAPLRAMGAAVVTTDGRPPVRVTPGSLAGIEWTLPVASAQVKSAILLAGLRARGNTLVREPHPTRDHSERLLRAMGAHLACAPPVVTIAGGQALRATTVPLPGDPSSAAFFAVAAAIVPRSRIVLPTLCLNPTRTGFVDVLERMGARIERRTPRDVAGEPWGDLAVEAAPLRGTVVAPSEVPATVDELPVLAVAAACAAGETRIEGAGELRVKESDRLDAMGQLAALGVEVDVLSDGLVIRGAAQPFHGARVSARGDHRIAMAFAVAGLRTPDGLQIDDAGAVDVSFPSFFEHLEALGAHVEHVA
jgi:3-phosphoshikimate 1-carboxyvinyltransferase